jgi:hypothetical protein
MQDETNRVRGKVSRGPRFRNYNLEKDVDLAVQSSMYAFRISPFFKIKPASNQMISLNFRLLLSRFILVPVYDKIKS